MLYILFIYIILQSLLIWTGNTFTLSTSIIIEVILLLSLIYLVKNKIQKTKLLGKPFLILYFIWCLIILIYSIFNIDNKENIAFFVHNSFSVLLFISVFLFAEISKIKIFFRLYVKYGIPLFLLLSPFMMRGCWGWYLVPIQIIIIFLPIIKTKWKFFFFFLFIMSIIDIDTRANLLRGAFSLVCLFLIIIRKSNCVDLFCKAFSISFLIAPFIFLYLGLSGLFNVFEFQNDKNDKFYADTRTLLYEEVITSSVNNGYILTGRTFSRGYDSKFQEQFSKLKKKAERTSEVSACNIYTWTGCIGLGLYFLCFIISIYYSVFRSHNTYIKILGLYLAFRWFMAFIEEINSVDPLNITIFIIMSLCLNPYLINQGNKTFIITIKKLTRS